MPLGASTAMAASAHDDLQSSFQFLVSAREQGGVLYRATAGELRDRWLPLSFVDSAQYWGLHVCENSPNHCAVTDRYDSAAYTLRPENNRAGDLQTERVNIHNGTNIYDAATWQIAVMLGHVRNGLSVSGRSVSKQSISEKGDAYALVDNQNRLLSAGHNGDALPIVENQNRALTRGDVYRYNGNAISQPSSAYVFRTLPRAWLAEDPLNNSAFNGWIKANNLPSTNPTYQRGRVTWTDWKPITGENAWAFLLGPLQSARIYFLMGEKQAFVPFHSLAVQNALHMLPTFAAMQSPLGAVYYAPAGTVANQGDALVNPYEVAVENNFSLYAGLILFRGMLQQELLHDKQLTATDKATINTASTLIQNMVDGGALYDAHDARNSPNKTAGLLSFFKNAAWKNGEFVQGGIANDPARTEPWVPTFPLRAVDVNTWGIAALGARQIDQWFGFGAAFNNWQRVKSWGGYGVDKTLWGVGFSDQDGNGIATDGAYRQGILSTEWTAGAITAVRNMQKHYRSIAKGSADSAKAAAFVQSLTADEQAMLKALSNLRVGNYEKTKFAGAPKLPDKSLSLANGAYLYASKRYMIPFGWYANPLPSTSSTAWMVMVANGFDPFGGAEKTIE